MCQSNGVSQPTVTFAGGAIMFSSGRISNITAVRRGIWASGTSRDIGAANRSSSEKENASSGNPSDYFHRELLTRTKIKGEI